MTRSPRAERLALAAALVLVVLFALPAIHTTFRFDDSDTFELRTGLLEARGLGFWEYFWRQVEVVFTSSRFQPMGVVLTFVPWVFSDAPALYKLHLIVLWAVALGLGFAVLRRLGMDFASALLAVVLAGALAQFHRYHDPLLGYVGMAQWSLISLSGSLLAWLRWDRDRRTRWLVLAVALWFVCLTFYEANLAFTVAALAVVGTRRSGARALVRGAAPFVVPALLVVAIGLVQSALHDDALGGYKPGGGLGAMFETALVMVAGAAPASYAVLDPHDLMTGFTTPELVGGLWRGVVAAVLVALLLARSGPAGPRALRGPLAVGLALWLLGGTPLAVAPKYQDELEWGMSYLPGLAQTAGMAIVLAVAALAAVGAARQRPRARRAVIGTLAVLAGGLTAVTGVANLRVVANERPTAEGRALLNDALRHGVLTGLPEPATIIGFARDLNWYPANFGLSKLTWDAVVADRTGRRDDTRVDRYMKPRGCRSPKWPLRPCADVLDEGGWLAISPLIDGGAAVMARAPRGRLLEEGALAEQLTVYLEGRLAGGPPVLTGLRADMQAWSSQGTTRWRLLRRGDGWSLWSGEFLEPAAAPVVYNVHVPEAKIDLLDQPPVDERVRWLGTKSLLP